MRSRGNNKGRFVAAKRKPLWAGEQGPSFAAIALAGVLYCFRRKNMFTSHLNKRAY